VNASAEVITKRGNHPRRLVCEIPRGREDEGLRAVDCRVDACKDGDAECSCLAGAGLRVHDHVAAFRGRDDGQLLDHRRGLEAVCVDALRKMWLGRGCVCGGRW
jgi:hypothetical protein